MSYGFLPDYVKDKPLLSGGGQDTSSLIKQEFDQQDRTRSFMLIGGLTFAGLVVLLGTLRLFERKQ